MNTIESRTVLSRIELECKTIKPEYKSTAMKKQQIEKMIEDINHLRKHAGVMLFSGRSGRIGEGEILREVRINDLSGCVAIPELLLELAEQKLRELNELEYPTINKNVDGLEEKIKEANTPDREWPVYTTSPQREVFIWTSGNVRSWIFAGWVIQAQSNSASLKNSLTRPYNKHTEITEQEARSIVGPPEKVVTFSDGVKRQYSGRWEKAQDIPCGVQYVDNKGMLAEALGSCAQYDGWVFEPIPDEYEPWTFETFPREIVRLRQISGTTEHTILEVRPIALYIGPKLFTWAGIFKEWEQIDGTPAGRKTGGEG